MAAIVRLDELPTRAEQEQAEAFQLYRVAAEQGITGAQCRLGVMYAEAGRRGGASGSRVGIRHGTGRPAGRRGLTHVDDPRGCPTHRSDSKRSVEVPHDHRGGDDAKADR